MNNPGSNIRSRKHDGYVRVDDLVPFAQKVMQLQRDGLSMPNVARRLGVPISTIRDRLRRLRLSNG
jgi:DNA-binding NarL/FixJ family response regulator